MLRQSVFTCTSTHRMLEGINLEVVEPPGFFGEAEILRDMPGRLVAAVANEDSRGLAVPAEIFKKLLTPSVRLCLRAVRRVATRAALCVALNPWRDSTALLSRLQMPGQVLASAAKLQAYLASRDAWHASRVQAAKTRQKKLVMQELPFTFMAPFQATVLVCPKCGQKGHEVADCKGLPKRKVQCVCACVGACADVSVRALALAHIQRCARPPSFMCASLLTSRSPSLWCPIGCFLSALTSHLCHLVTAAEGESWDDSHHCTN